MRSKITKRALFFCLGLLTIWSAPVVFARGDAVIILRNGERIAATILDISSQSIRFEAKNDQQAFRYGAEIGIGEVKGIETPEGEILSVEHYQAYLENRSDHAKPNNVPQRQRVEPTPAPRTEPPPARQRPISSNDRQVEEFVNSLLEAGLASEYLNYLNTSGKNLNRTEVEIKRMIEKSPEWRDKLDDLRYIDKIAFEALSRAYYYKPDELKSSLNLRFDEETKMNFPDLMAQLYERLGAHVSQSDFNALVDVFGTGGARAIRDIMKDYSSWKFATAK